MTLINDVLGGLLGGNSGAGGGGSALQSVLTSVLGGQQAGGPMQQGQGYGGQGYQGQNNPMQTGQDPNYGGQMGAGMGGLGGLMSAFGQAGLGHVIQSWIGSGPNQPVSPGQLSNVFGQDRVDSMAAQSGMSSGDFLSQLSEHLPKAVDGMTPNGQLPEEGSVSV